MTDPEPEREYTRKEDFIFDFLLWALPGIPYFDTEKNPLKRINGDQCDYPVDDIVHPADWPVCYTLLYTKRDGAGECWTSAMGFSRWLWFARLWQKMALRHYTTELRKDQRKWKRRLPPTGYGYSVTIVPTVWVD